MLLNKGHMKAWRAAEKRELLQWYTEPAANEEIRNCYDIIDEAEAAGDNGVRAKLFDFTFEPFFYKVNVEITENGRALRGQSDLQTARIIS